jgi:hypothetical protein
MSQKPRAARSRSFTKFLSAAFALAMAVMLTVTAQHHFARPDLRAFEPQEMGRMKAAMWRSYYEGHWMLLGWQAMQLARNQCAKSAPKS